MSMGKERTFIHLDMDAYFASIEQRDNPRYRGRPLMVCHSDDAAALSGVVSAASYEARPYGIKSGTSVFEAKKLCPQGVYLIGNYDKYAHNTQQLIDICGEFTDRIEVFSIDEMWLDVTETKRFFGDQSGRLAHLLRQRIRQRLGLSSSIGVGPNRLVAKMAGEFHKPGGITVIRPHDLPDILAPLPVGDLFGVGRRIKKRLGAVGVITIGDLAELPSDYLRKNFGVMGLWLKRAAQGLDDSVLAAGRHQTAPIVKSFGHSSALGGGEADPDQLSRILLGLCEGVTRRMRRRGYAGRTITLRLCLARLFGFTRSLTIPEAVDLTERIYPIARDLLLAQAGILGRYPATLIGVSVGNLVRDQRQLSIFDALDGRQSRLALAVDSINDKYGDRSVTKATLVDWRRRYHGVESSRLGR
jgi:DNA polymerase IV